MKENSVLHVLMYLFQNHMRDNYSIESINTDLVDQLESAGFILPVINQAIGWLANLAEDRQDVSLITEPHTDSFRVYSDYERELLGDECIIYLNQLEQQGILTPFIRETVIHQIMELQSEGIDLSLVKWVTLMVLFNQPDQEEALTCMELLVLEHPPEGIH